MINFFQSGGPTMWILLILFVTIIVLSIKKSIDLFFRSNQNAKKLERGINSILFFGSLSVVFGVLGQLSGVYLALNIISSAPDISPQIVFIGLSQSLISTMSGLWILIISAIIWFILRAKYKILTNSQISA